MYRINLNTKKMIEMKQNVTPGETPAEITISMIDQDLKDGITKPEMAIKYGIKPWEVDEMFKHPLLKGRRPARKRTLSFSFVDDMSKESIPYDVTGEDKVNPDQVTLEQAIDNAIETVDEVKDQVQETQDAIIDMLSPTEFETPEETLLKAAVNTPEEKNSLEGKTFEECLDTVIDESTGETLEDSLTNHDYKDQFDREENDPEYQEYRDSKEKELEDEDDNTFEL